MIYLSQMELSRTELLKCTRSTLMKNFYHAIFPVLSILFWYDPVCKARLLKKFFFELQVYNCFTITCILVRQAVCLKKLCVTSFIRVKESEGGLFILVLDWILVYVTSIMWMNLSPKPNLVQYTYETQTYDRRSFERTFVLIWNIWRIWLKGDIN